MPFNAQTWIDDIVRTSHYILPNELPDCGDLDASPDALVQALAAIRTTQVDANPAAALMPARVPQGSQIPSALNTHFEDVVQGLAAYGIDLHPAVRHALLAVALSAPDRENKLDALKPLMTGIDNGLVYQPTMTWTALLRPQWYDPKHYVTPVLKGGVEPSKSAQGVTSAIVLTEDNMRINAAHMFSWAKPVELTQAKIPAPASVWAELADKAWGSPNPPATSLWAMSFGDQKKWWSFLPPGAAAYNPFYTQQHLTDLFINSTQHSDVTHTTRMGYGIADIFPIAKDTALANYVPIGFLLDAPASLNTWLSMYHHAKAPNVVFSIPPQWLDDLTAKISLVKSLDMLPKYSIFNDDALSQSLSAYRQDGDLQRLQTFMEKAVERQMVLRGQTDKNSGDVFDIGLPIDRYFVASPALPIVPLPAPADEEPAPSDSPSVTESFLP